VREASQQLQSEGLVEIFPQRGIQITPVSAAMVRDLFGVRRLLEVPGIKL
jgi:DNA-binding GntR family transcriptional regulator